MYPSITWYRSNTMRALLVAMVAFVLERIGLSDALLQASTQQIVDHLLGGAQGIALLAAFYARAALPSPALAITQAAADLRNEEEDRRNIGDRDTSPPPEG